MKKIGLSLLVSGIFLPLLVFPFLSLSKTAWTMKLAFAERGADYIAGIDDRVLSMFSMDIPFKYIFFLGTILSLVGVVFVVFFKDKNIFRRKNS